MAQRDVNGDITEAFIREPLGPKGFRVREGDSERRSKLDVGSPGFLASYSTARASKFASPEAELLWVDFAQLCAAHGAKRAIPEALRAGLYCSDQVESPAESLLVARCVELGFKAPDLQVTILGLESGRALGRADGLWASPEAMRGMCQRDGKLGRLLYCRKRGDNDSLVIELNGRLKYQGEMQPSRLRSMLKAANVPLARHNWTI
jgi:hypothetical protein